MRNFIQQQTEIAKILIPIAPAILGFLFTLTLKSADWGQVLFFLGTFFCGVSSLMAGVLSITGFASKDNPRIKQTNQTLILERSQKMVAYQVGFLIGSLLFLFAFYISRL